MDRVLTALVMMIVWFVKPVAAFEIGAANTNCSGNSAPGKGRCDTFVKDFAAPMHQDITILALCNKLEMSTVNNCPASNVPIPGPPASIGTFQYTTSSGGMVFFTYSAITEIEDGNIWGDASQHLPPFHFPIARLTHQSDTVSPPK